jgi:hypothetical protein
MHGCEMTFERRAHDSLSQSLSHSLTHSLIDSLSLSLSHSMPVPESYYSCCSASQQHIHHIHQLLLALVPQLGKAVAYSTTPFLDAVNAVY